MSPIFRYAGRGADAFGPALACWLLTMSPATALPEIWFAPPDNMPRFGIVPMADFPRLFDPEPAWLRALSHVHVFSLGSFYIQRAPEADLRRVLGFLEAHRIALDVGLQALPSEDCGQGVEGITPSVKEPIAVARRLRQMGANVRSFSFDEPLEYGHIYKGRAACRYPVREVARRVGMTVQGVREFYPGARFIDYEVAQDEPLPEWKETLSEWLSAFKAETGDSLDGLLIDVHFRDSWEEPIRATIDILHANGVRAGLFLTAGGGSTVTDESWMEEAKGNVRSVFRAQLPLDFVDITTWAKHPTRILPETDPLSLTSLIHWYVECRDRRIVDVCPPAN